jgi:hypothetical protein
MTTWVQAGGFGLVNKEGGGAMSAVGWCGLWSCVVGEPSRICTRPAHTPSPSCRVDFVVVSQIALSHAHFTHVF